MCYAKSQRSYSQARTYRRHRFGYHCVLPAQPKRHRQPTHLRKALGGAVSGCSTTGVRIENSQTTPSQDSRARRFQDDRAAVTRRQRGYVYKFRPIFLISSSICSALQPTGVAGTDRILVTLCHRMDTESGSRSLSIIWTLEHAT